MTAAIIRSCSSLLMAALAALILSGEAQAKDAAPRTVVADVVAINQPIVYNRFGSKNPWGMIYALRRDTVGTAPGEAMLKKDRRPRPLVLRVAAGDILEIRFQNLLKPMPAGAGNGPDPEAEEPEAQEPQEETVTVPDPPNDPRTRLASIAIVGLAPENGNDPRATGLVGVKPGEQQIYRFRTDKPGSYFFSSLSAVAGGEGNGGSLTHGLFGMVIVEPKGAKFYRSQVTAEALACARGQPSSLACTANPRKGWIDYEARGADGIPLINMLRENADGTAEIVHGDLTAIIVDPNTAGSIGQPASASYRNGTSAWREFAIMFHDELKTVHAKEFAILNDPVSDSPIAKARNKQLAGARDGFAINYGASGMGPVVLANRMGKGPAKTCVDCAYEEFFLQSWANGDPALLAQYRDDPSNVYHSYLGDRVRFYNVHAGPKETHVFHLHAHQWLSQATNKTSNYLDSQTIAPFQNFSYEIYYGGTGNRNLTPGDSIFHCHLYPHFAQGMWGLWRVHEVLEDGTRALPDGGGMQGEHAGLGTNPENGQTAGGTPIPGLVPLPGQALPPEPTYMAQAGDKAMPGYPFYIPGKAGFRAPQPPLDMDVASGGEDGGLPRHLTLEGTRTLKPIEAALDAADMTYPITKVKLQILPQSGTALEKAAMAFHAKPGGLIARPNVSNLSLQSNFLVNGLAAAAGSPFANPCPETGKDARHWVPGLKSKMTGMRTYDVSAIQMPLLVNQYGWHDKQARINVRSSEALAYEQRAGAGAPFAADPFFFRARSGECIVFRHTNRTPGTTAKDAFQVATPVDIIGQHIHLVKFDVTSSDGSANGFNYEDGTLARDHIGHLIEASHGTVDWSVSGESPRELALKTDANGNPVYQTTIQRWWADPLLDEKGRDRTISTVFTHDHFGPSTIQQHGFYSALLIEPRGSTWKKPDGTLMEDSQGQAVGTQAIIETPKGRKVAPHLIGSRREFAMAIADFALLYDKTGQHPIAPPERPESISVDHHDPYMINYKHEPFPLRIGTEDGSGRWQQRTGDRGDMAYVFDSITHAPNSGSSLGSVDLRRNHVKGDPSTEIFEAYVGDPVQVRLVQGAQEVQHVFTVAGRSWRRQAAAPDSAIVSAQEIGISEHFEMDFSLPFNARYGGQTSFDYLYTAGTIDALWNGAWGLLRAYPNPSSKDPAAAALAMRCRLAVLGAPGSTATNAPDSGDCGNARPATSAADAQSFAAIPASLPATGIAGLGSTSFVRPDAVISGRLFCINAVAVQQIYNGRDGIADPNAARFQLARQYAVNISPDSWFTPTCNEAAQDTANLRYRALPTVVDAQKPMVLRMRSGEFGFAEVVNAIGTPARTNGNAVLPPIVSSSSSSRYSDGTANDRITPSASVGLTPQLVSVDIRQNAGLRVGLNVTPLTPGSGVPAVESIAKNQADGASMAWYAGRTTLRRKGGKPEIRFEPFKVKEGLISALSSWADPIRHPVMGLVGALVIEPENAEILDEQDGGIMATICTGNGKKRSCFKEAVLVYQDGLNLKKQGVSIPDCHVCDDTYDSGDIAFNYRTEPLWSRMGLPTQQGTPNDTSGRPQLGDLSDYTIPADILLSSFKPIETPNFKVCAGDRLIVRAVHPGGRARQRAFVTYGHEYADQAMPGFGSPHSSLLAPQRAISADLGKIREGRWLFRDGAGQFFAGGAWGYIEGSQCPTP